MSAEDRTAKATVLAVDAGGTHCRAGLYDPSGNLLAYAEGGPSNYQSCGAEPVARTFSKVFAALRANYSPRTDQQEQGHAGISEVIEYSASGSPTHPSSAPTNLGVEVGVFGLAGLDTPEDYKVLNSIIRQAMLDNRITANNVYLENDALMTLKGHLGDRPGILMISGTGSIVYGQDASGRQHRAGGWGHLAGDEGSGFYIGSSAIRHVFRVADGRDAPSGVLAAILQHLSLPSRDAVLSWVYSNQYSASGVAGLAESICELAATGDSAAQSIVLRAAADLASIAASVVKHLGFSGSREIPIVLSGGVIQGSAFFRNEVLDLLQQEFPNLKVIPRKHEPIYSAALYGLYQLGYEEMML